MERAGRVLPGTRWVCVYGATEMLPAVVVDGADKVAAATLPGPTASAPPSGDLIGTPLRGVTARIEAPDDDGVGELVISGPSLMAGYLADLDAGRPPVVEHRTGDLARADDDGRITLVGRTRDMIIRGTVNIYPGLFEPRIQELPGVGDALMVGVPRDDGDERVVLVLVPDRAHAGNGGERAGHRPTSSDTVKPAAGVAAARGMPRPDQGAGAAGMKLAGNSPLIGAVGWWAGR
jgi:acyl-CoA synthetase (AMP-forming)/AMP-acid ligase II